MSTVQLCELILCLKYIWTQILCFIKSYVVFVCLWPLCMVSDYVSSLCQPRQGPNIYCSCSALVRFCLLHPMLGNHDSCGWQREPVA